MLRGRGIAQAERWVKDAELGPRYAISEEGPDEASFEGFECRWQPVKSRRGHIVSLIVTKMLDPIFAPIQLQFDQARRRAKLSIPGVLQCDVEPIKNPVTGSEHRIQVVMPEGFEHIAGEVAAANINSTGAIKFATKGTHSTLAHVVQTPQGVAA